MKSSDLVPLLKKNPLPVGCLVLSLALIGAIYFRSDAVPEANAQLDEKSTLARRYAQNITNSSQLKEQFDAIVTANKEIEGRMIRASQLGINQQYFYKLESEHGVKLTELVQNTRTAGKGTYVPIGFSITVQGDFPAVMDFLQALENGAHYCRVLAATCSGSRSGPVTLVLNLDLLGHP